MEPSNTTVVIACYKRPTDWALRLEEMGFDVRRYTKEDPTSPYNVEKNVGMEASAYLKYCLDSYGVFKEYTIFLHDEEYSWHHEGSIIDRICEAIHWSGNYRTLNNSHNLPFFYCRNEYHKNILDFYNNFLCEYIGPLEQFGEFMGSKRIGAAQMIIHRDAILARPIEMYGRIYDFIMSLYNVPDAAKESGIMMEYFWGIIFGDVRPIDWSKRDKICVITTSKNYIATYCRQAIDFYEKIEDVPDLSKYSSIINEPLQDNFNFDHFYTLLTDNQFA